ncbi:MAG: ABC transporter permease [Chloroflexi bacterium OLB15]|nr:MAG: ABC transporter permease [Chloroflexi bacterium OLB15]
MAAAANQSKAVNTAPFYSHQLRKFGIISILTLFAFMLVFLFLLPFANMALISVKTTDQITEGATGVIWPMEPITYTYDGDGDGDQDTYDLYIVPMPDGSTRQLALVQPGRQSSQFLDPSNPEAGLIAWEGNWRGLSRVTELHPHFENFQTAWDMLDFPKVFRNTLIIALTGMIGTLLSSICVAYAFARFPIPGKNIWFIILIGTIILPSQVTLIPTYAFFAKIGWTGTWLPLIVPHFFANAFNVFLLRQFFMTLPRELDEAAMIDGAGPFKVLTSVIIPQSWAAIIAVAMFHIIFAWNDYFNPLIYLLGQPDLLPISVAVQQFNFQYGPRPELVQATSLMAMVLPLVLFLFAQKVFMRGVVITGVEK